MNIQLYIYFTLLKDCILVGKYIHIEAYFNYGKK